jgi:hypothetical protein
MVDCNPDTLKQILKRSSRTRSGYNRNDDTDIIIIKDNDHRRRDGFKDILPILLLTLLGNNGNNRNNILGNNGFGNNGLSLLG